MSEHFHYRNGELHAEAVAVARIAAAVGTPFYVYSAGAFEAAYHAFAAAFAPERPLICFAVKANSNLAVLRVFHGLGAGADVVSEGELRRALAAGFRPEQIIFSGVGKTRGELEYALAIGIHRINVESVPELHRLSDIATSSGRTARVAIRVNPDVDAGSHNGISTGRKGDKFGIAHEDAAAAYRLAADLPGIEAVGLTVHIGSKIEDLGPSRLAFSRMVGLVRDLRGAGLAVGRLDVGGGLTVPYKDGDPVVSPSDYAAAVREAFGDLDLALEFEPGRYLVAAGGVLVSTVVYVKDGDGHPVVVLDAAMNDLIRPALYQAHHNIRPVRAPSGAALAPADVVGPVCESTDTFARNRDLPPLSEGDLVVFETVGAYGATMSSTYNSRRLIPEVLVAGSHFAVIRERPSYEAMLGMDAIPDWLGAPVAEPAGKRGAA